MAKWESILNTTIQNSKWSKSMNYNQPGSTNGATERLVATLVGFLTSQPSAAARSDISVHFLNIFGFRSQFFSLSNRWLTGSWFVRGRRCEPQPRFLSKLIMILIFHHQPQCSTLESIFYLSRYQQIYIQLVLNSVSEIGTVTYCLKISRRSSWQAWWSAPTRLVGC